MNEVEQEARVEDEGKDFTSGEHHEELAVVAKTEDSHAMLIQNYGGLEMQEFTQHPNRSLSQLQDLQDDL